MPRYRSAKLLLFDANGNVLVLRRSNTHPTAALAPDLPGGMIEANESYESGVIRELIEETKLELSVDRLVRVDKKGSRFSVMQRILYGATIDMTYPRIELSWEHDQYEWMPIEKLKSLEAPVQKQVDSVLKKGRHKKL